MEWKEILRKLTTEKNLRRIALIVIWGIYLWMLFGIWTINADIINGTKLLEESYVFSNGQLTAYVSGIVITVAVIVMLKVITFVLCPEWTLRGRIIKLERKMREDERSD